MLATKSNQSVNERTNAQARFSAVEDLSRKEVDRRSGEVKLDTKVNGHRCTGIYRKSKDKWPHVPDILCLLDVRIEGDTG